MTSHPLRGQAYSHASYQPLDHSQLEPSANRRQVRDLLERSGKVLAAVQGHYHPGDCRYTGTAHYVTLRAMVTGPGLESNAYCVLEGHLDGTLHLQGFGGQMSFTLPPASAGSVAASAPGL